ncbi:hypothetical protein PSTT_03656, partial [Puccinia striiformis]
MYILKPFDVIEHPTDNLKVGNNNGVSIGLNNIIVGKSNFIVDLSSYASCLTALTKDEECSLSREMMKKIKTNDCTVLYKQYTGSANPQTGSPDRLLRPKGWAAYQVIVVAVLQGYMQIGLQAHKIESRGPHKTSPRDLQLCDSIVFEIMHIVAGNKTLSKTHPLLDRSQYQFPGEGHHMVSSDGLNFDFAASSDYNVLIPSPTLGNDACDRKRSRQQCNAGPDYNFSIIGGRSSQCGVLTSVCILPDTADVV